MPVIIFAINIYSSIKDFDYNFFIIEKIIKLKKLIFIKFIKAILKNNYFII